SSSPGPSSTTPTSAPNSTASPPRTLRASRAVTATAGPASRPPPAPDHPAWPPLSRGGPNPGDPMTNLPETGDRARALGLLEAAEFMRDAHFRDGLTVQEITTALAHTVDRADAMVGS